MIVENPSMPQRCAIAVMLPLTFVVLKFTLLFP